VSESYEQRAFTVPRDGRELIVVRHGASAGLREGETFDLVGGHGDPPLSPAGREQAVRAAERLDGEPIRAIFVTPLQRTAQTAEPLVAATGIEPRVIEDLREVHLGEWEGGEYRIRMAERDPIAVRALMEERWDVIPGAERMEDFALRVRAGIEAVVAAAGPDVSVAAVVHGGVIGEACRQATDSRPFAFVHADNGSLSRLVVVPGGPWLLRSFNDTAHLA
jgi:2,3-bisphosphoglycerate-dependent phosphoglycerate mutase